MTNKITETDSEIENMSGLKNKPMIKVTSVANQKLQIQSLSK